MVEEGYKLSWLERDALREITSIGAGNATTALSKMMKRRIDVTIPQLNIISIKTIPDIMGGPEKVVTAICMGITGDTQGSLVLLFDKTSSLQLTDVLQGREIGSTKKLSEEDMNRLREMGNILAKTSLDAMSEFLDLDIKATEAGVANDMVNALMDTVLAGFAVKSDYATLLEVEFQTPPTRVRGHFFLIFDIDTVDTIVSSIEKKLAG